MNDERKSNFKATASGGVGGALAIVAIIVLDNTGTVKLDTATGAVLVVALQTIFTYAARFLPKPPER